MKRATLILTALALLLGGVGQAKAGFIYTSGAISGKHDAYGGSGGYSNSDSFTPAVSGSLTSASVGFWTSAGFAPSSLQWSIGTTPFASDVGSGTANSLTNVQLTPISSYGVGGTYYVYDTSFTLTGTLTSGTTYWFTLNNTTDSGGGEVSWDDIFGYPTLPAFQAGPNGIVAINQSSFTLYGSPTGTPEPAPEPATLTLLGIGAVGLLGYCWRRRKRAAA